GGRVDGFNTVFKMKTDKTGWINGCDFKGATVINFEHVSVVEKSAQSLGIDYNVFSLTIQTGEATKELFLDSDSSNSYDNCRIWDISHAENARFGLGRMKGVINGTSYPK